MKDNPLRALEALGQSVWLDAINRGMLVSGELKRLIKEDGVSGMTSNPALFGKAITDGAEYEDQIRESALAGSSVQELYESLVITDIRLAADQFRPVYDRTNGADGFVSLEVSPHLAGDTDGTIAEARRLWARVERPNLMIKVPATVQGIPAIRMLIGEGINVNITLLFGLERYREVARAYLDGLEESVKQGESLAPMMSVASFFLSRIDVLADPILDDKAKAGGKAGRLAAGLKGETALASARAAYGIFLEIFGGKRFKLLASKGARVQRLLWASTGTKDPAYSDVKYVEPLIAPETINTLPLETLAAYRDHGRPSARLARETEDAARTLKDLASAGIDLDAVTRQLEEEGIRKFIVPYDQLMLLLEKRRAAAPASASPREGAGAPRKTKKKSAPEKHPKERS